MAIILLASCSTSNQVVSNKLFQKRKYQKGWHVNKTKSHKKTNEAVAVEAEFRNEPDSTYVTEETSKTIKSKAEEIIEVPKAKFEDIEKSLYLKPKLSKPIRTKKLPSRVFAQFNGMKTLSQDIEISYQTPPINREEPISRFLLNLLGIGIILYLGAGPLGLLISKGKIEPLKTNLLIWLVGVMFLSMGLILGFYIGGFLFPTFIGLIITGGVFIAIANIHAIVVIIRGY